MKFHLNGRFRRWMFSVVALLFVALSSSAAAHSNWNDKTFFTLNFNPKTGNIEIYLVCQIDKEGPLDGQGWSEDGWAELTYQEGNGPAQTLVKVKKEANFSDGPLDGNWIHEADPKLTYKIENPTTIDVKGDRGTLRAMTFYYPVNPEVSYANIRVNGHWFVNGSGGDHSVDLTKRIDYNISLSDIRIGTKEYTNDVAGGYAISWNSGSNSTCDQYSQIGLYYSNGNKVTVEGSNPVSGTSTSGRFIVKGASLDNSSTYYLKRIYTAGSVSKTWSTSLSRPPYPQVSGISSVTFDREQLRANVKFNIDNAPTDAYDGNFFVTAKVKDTKLGKYVDSYNQEITVPYSSSTKEYSCGLNIPAEGDYEVETWVGRKNVFNWSNWSKYKKYSMTTYSNEHSRIETATATKSAEGDSVLLEWTTAGSYWSKGSSLVIRRYINKDFSHYEEFQLDEDQYKAKKWTDKGLTPCQGYSYKLQVMPAEGSKYTAKALVATTNFANDVKVDEIVFTEVGEILYVNSSKGYFSDGVELKWEADGVFDYYNVSRRVYNESGSNQFELAGTVKNEAAVENVFRFKDEKVKPGIIYEYQIEGVVKCYNTEIKKRFDKGIFGFSTATGNVEGRVAYENGQGVPGVDMRLTSEAKISQGSSMKFGGTSKDYLATDDEVKQHNRFYTFQALVRPAAAGANGMLMKRGNYELGVKDGMLYFKTGVDEVDADRVLDLGKFTSVSAGYRKDEMGEKLFLVVYGNDGVKEWTANKSELPEIVKDSLTIGQNFKGHIDEVRVWNKGLTLKEIEDNHSRYLTGGEDNLVAYYRFNDAVSGNFFDFSHAKEVYNEKHGRTYGNVVYDNAVVPTFSELAFCSKTDDNGNYRIVSVPYEGKGTTYTLTPTMGIHKFKYGTGSEQGNTTFTLGEGNLLASKDFTDISSFSVKGVVYYEGTKVPVKGVQFMIDGKYAVNKENALVESGADGVYALNVPIGIHEVKAIKNQHTFVNDGKLVDHEGNLNYQENLTEVHFYDNTKVKLIGRIVGGDVESAYPEGHSMSTNNLGDTISLTLELEKKGLDLTTKEVVKDTVKHFHPEHQNEVVTTPEKIKIYMDKGTGEYVAYLIPERFKVTSIAISGYPGNFADDLTNNIVDLTNKLVEQPSLSKPFAPEGTPVDTVYYNDIFSHNKLNEPNYSFKEVYVRKNDKDSTIYVDKDFFGNEYEYVSTFDESGKSVREKVLLYDGKNYTFKKPVYKSKGEYSIMVSAYKSYYYNNDMDGKVDRVPIINGSVKVENTMKDSICTIKLNQEGKALYTFRPDNPDVENSNGGVRKIEFILTANDRTYPSKVLEGIVLGSKGTGANFVTEGPTRLLMVLRDPPGSHSYTYTSETVTTTHENSANVTWAASNDVTAKVLVGYSVEQSVGAPGAEIVTEIASGEANIGTNIKSNVDGQEELKGSNTYTINSQIRTSADPDFVGRDADLLVGNSTNVIIGAMNTLGFKPVETLSAEEQGQKIAEYGGFALCVNKSISTEEQFATMFAYPQVHIENVLIPQCDEMISQLLEKGRGLNPAQAKAKANELNEPIFVPHLEKGDPHYGMSNPDGADLENIRGAHAVGEYYDIYFSDDNIQKYMLHEADLKDSLLTLEISKKNWINVLYENERQKIEAFKNNPDQNLSYQGGATIEQSIGYASDFGSTTTSNFQLSLGFLTEIEGTIAKVGTSMSSVAETSAGGGAGYTYDKNNETTIGFVLEDEGEDYMSVDVYKPNAKKEHSDIKSSGYIFRLRGGATSGPYEGVQYTKYFEPGQHKLSEGSLLVEKPVITVSPASVANVPSNKPAVFTLKMYNESEAQRDCIFDLKLVDSSNSNGAKFSIDGVALGAGRPFEVPYGDILTKKLEVLRGAEEFDYEDMKVVLVSQSQNDPFSNNGVIADTINLSAHFVPTSTDVNLKSPGNGWTLNVMSEGDEKSGYYMPVLVDGFDINDPNFDRIEVQYKPTSEPKQWTTLRTFYKDPEHKFERPEAEEHIGNQTVLTAKFTGAQDQRYDIKAVSFTKYGDEFVTAESKIATGVKDTQRPQLFGLPTPANGILNVDDVIGLTFNEEIAGGYLTRSNFEITAVKNGSKSDRSVAVKMDGVNDAVVSEFGKDWSNRSLTINGWVKFEDLTTEQCIFALGEQNNGCTLKYNGLTGQFNFASNDGKVFNLTCSTKSEAIQANLWYNVAAVVDFDAETVYLYLNYEEIGSAGITSEYKCDGQIFLGRDVKNQTHFKGCMDDFRVWDKAMNFSDIKTTADRRLSGAEPSLIAYYPMDEARGEVVLDKARGNNARLTGDWSTPLGYAMNFDGQNDVLVIKSGNVPVKRSEDFTLEFWFKSNDNAQNATLLCNGSADGADFGDGSGLLRVAFEKGQLVVCTAGNVEKVAGTYNDKNWHHFLLTVSRSGGYAQVYMDEKLAHYFDGKKVGDFAATELYAGARRYEKIVAAAGETTTDQYFNGVIDEIRLWHNSFTQSSVENNANKLVSGKEMGLMAYYPFEEWVTNISNLRELLPSLKEMVAKQEEAVAEGGLTETKKDHAPLVEGGVEEPVGYDFVANKEGLILNLTEPEERIDNTILNIAVSRVLDANGNPMEGVVRWSAFVDRNPIRWADAKKDIKVQQGEESEFTIALNNTSGVVKNFNIEGVPAWLEVTPMAGKIEPNAAVDVHFAVSSGVNVGRYDEMVYARGDNNVAAALPLNVKVNGHKPDWKVDTNKYEHNMSIFGQMLFDGALSNDKEDIVAIFNNGECVGLSNSVYDKKRDMWYTYLTVYVDEIPTADKDLKNLYEFRMWDASTGQLYAGSVNSLVFENGICGSLSDLVQISGQEVKIRDLSLNEGWNWVSFAVLPQATNSNVILKNGSWNKDDVIKNASRFDSYSAETHLWEGTLQDTYDRTQMYMLRTTNAQSLNIEGTEKADAKVHVAGQRWNYIGYTPKFNLTVNEALAGYRAEEGDVVKSQTQFAMYTDGDWVGSLKYMEVNKGYMLYRKAAGDADFAYPSMRGSYSSVKAARFATFAPVVAEQKYANNLTIVATPAYQNLEEGDIIKAYVNGELRGCSQIVNRNDEELHFLTISGNDEGQNIVFSLERNGKEVAKSSTVVPFTTNATIGSVTKAVEISFDATEDKVSVYPNPFVSYLNIQFFAEQDGEAEISIYDLSGRLIMLKTLQAHAGINKYTWHGETNQSAQLAGGLHLVRVTVDGKTTVHEVIKK